MGCVDRPALQFSSSGFGPMHNMAKPVAPKTRNTEDLSLNPGALWHNMTTDYSGLYFKTKPLNTPKPPTLNPHKANKSKAP